MFIAKDFEENQKNKTPVVLHLSDGTSVSGIVAEVSANWVMLASLDGNGLVQSKVAYEHIIRM